MKVKVNTGPTKNVVSIGIQGPPGTTIYDSNDFDMTEIKDGSVLVYKEITNKWTSTTTLDAQNMEGGEF